MDGHCPRAWRATMTEESSEVPRELTGKSGAAAGSPSAPAHPSPPPPCPPPAFPQVPRSRGAPQVAAVLGGAPGTLLASRRRESPVRGGRPWGAAETRECGAPPQPRRGWGRSRWAGCLGLGSSGGEEHRLQRPAPCPKLGEVGERPAQGRGEGVASAQWVVSGTCRALPPSPGEVLLPHADSGEGALVASAD